MEHARHNKRNISVAYIDFRKAYDSVSHVWIIRMLEMYKFSPTLVKFLEASMQLWNTHMSLSYQNARVSTESVRIRRGIFQGDTLSPLLFS